MKEMFERIWEIALPYQDKRDDPGHAEVALGFATSLATSEGAAEDIVVPAIILHDVGYSQLPKEQRLKVFDRSLKEDERLVVQREHEEAGVKLAGELLNRVNYPQDMAREILEIVSQHDTRKGFISKNEGIVRDGDKLWRFSKKCFEAGAKRNPDEKPRFDELEASIDKPDYFYSEKARQIAREELTARKNEDALRSPADK